MTLLLYHQQCVQVAQHKKHLEQYFKGELRPTPTLQLLVSIPGIGDITGAIIAMETGEISRFANDKHYASYCRLAPGARDSGGKHRHRSGSKDGNQYLKYAFTEAALKAMRFYPEVRQFAAQLERRSNPAIARTVVAKELSKITYYVLSREEAKHSQPEADAPLAQKVSRSTKLVTGFTTRNACLPNVQQASFVKCSLAPASPCA